jgi:hypothetical protein
MPPQCLPAKQEPGVAVMTGSPASAGRCADAAVTNWMTAIILEGCPLLVVAGT